MRYTITRYADKDDGAGRAELTIGELVEAADYDALASNLADAAAAVALADASIEILTGERDTLRALVEELARVEVPRNLPDGPYFVTFDVAKDCPPHKNSGLAMVDTGRSGDWPIARLCEWNKAEAIALLPTFAALAQKAREIIK